MRGVWHELLKHAAVYGRLVRMNVLSQLSYRTNFVTGVVMELAFLLSKLLYAVVAFRAGRDIAGLTPDEMLVFVGTFVTATGFFAGLFMMNLFQLSERLSDGSFDTLMTKPVSLQFLATLWRCDAGLFLVDVAGGAIVTAVGLTRLSGLVELWRILGYVFFLASGTMLAYAIYLFPQSLVFAVRKAGGLASVAVSFWEVNNVPVSVYGRLARVAGTYLVPMFVITSFPSLFVLGRLTGAQMLWGVLAPVAFLMLSRLAWRAGLGRYMREG